MAAKILLVNPPIYDFSAYDFWLKPYGMLSVAGFLRNQAEFKLFDYLDRQHPFVAEQKQLQSDRWSRGRFYCEKVPSPPCLAEIPRYFRRFGLPREYFLRFLSEQPPCDHVFIQTTMTYWYPAVRETIEDIRRIWPKAKVILGGNYVTICSKHAETSGADFLVKAANLKPLWEYLHIEPDLTEPPLWEVYKNLNVGILRLTDGCPFNCTYCSVPNVYGRFKARTLQHSLAELELLVKQGVKNIAFYDDALLFKAEEVLIPFLEQVIRCNIKADFHTPNALNARFVTPQLAKLMVRVGFKTFYLGFESISLQWQQRTGSKVSSDELAQAVKSLVAAGVEPTSITAYQILGHPDTDTQQLEASMRYANSLGIRVMLADFAPIQGTPDGERCREWVNMDEPLFHNKTVFPIILLGFNEVNRLKSLQQRFNCSLAR